MEVSGQLHAPAALHPRKEASRTHWIGGWVGPRAILDAAVKRKFPSPRENGNLEPRTLRLYETNLTNLYQLKLGMQMDY